MTANTTNWNCNWNATGTGTWYGGFNNTRTQYRVHLQAPLGEGKIAEMAVFCEEIELNPTCRSHEGVGYLTVKTLSKTKIDKFNKKAEELGFNPGDVNPEGKTCKCSVL